ncbi:MAG: MerR family transcriptional regulator [Mycobacterium sp.]
MGLSEYRLDELATLSGVSARNIRAYRERGLLDPPRREGRLALYDDHHLSQLRTINELLRKGFTSAHIAEFLASTRNGHDLAGILGLQQSIFGERRHGAVVAAGVDPDGDEARRLVQHGLAEIVDDGVTLVDPNIAEIVGRAPEQLPYVQTILRVADGIADLLDELAAAVVRALEAGLAARFGTNYVPKPEDMVELSRLVTDYRALGRRVVADQLEDALQRIVVNAVSDYTPDTVPGGQRDQASP